MWVDKLSRMLYGVQCSPYLIGLFIIACRGPTEPDFVLSRWLDLNERGGLCEFIGCNHFKEWRII